MKYVCAEGTYYLYFTRSDGVPSATVMGLRIWHMDDYMVDRLTTGHEMSDVRLGLDRSLRPGLAITYYLHWDDGRDLNALDRRVEEDTYNDEDFKHSAKTHHARTLCFTCHLKWDTLVMDGGDPYYGARHLLQEKITSHRILRCPNCGASLRQLVVKIFDSVGIGQLDFTPHLPPPTSEHAPS
jgi:hypothetical protein